jgi:hypothetical protein
MPGQIVGPTTWRAYPEAQISHAAAGALGLCQSGEPGKSVGRV